ncbi:ABC transporter ATP-binding protein [Thalassobacillus sp. CUG 92003]|uniref:ABC transporter ATP-binding protein n=1 Tax=Thalassobacillus sp. CUG 92003 TaxID=2736641 RepID=UPI0015E6F8BB|nr:ABC transporter ATP-binding protein [Thalassobacillus sp. CUG 92003]
MLRMFSYIHTYKRAAIIALLLMLIELAVELVQPLFMARIIDDGIMQEDFSVVAKWGGVLIGLSLLAFAAGITNSFFAAHASQGVGHDVRRDLFANVQSFTRANFHNFSTPTLITRMTNDVIQIQNVLFMGLRIALRAPLFIIGGMVMAFIVHATLALLLLIAVPLLLLFLFWILTQGVKLFRLVQHKLDDVNTVIRENLANVRLIKGFNRGHYEASRFERINTYLKEKNKHALWMMEVAMPVVMLGMNAVIVIILWVGAVELNMGSAQAGEIVAVINYATRIMFTFSVFTFLIMTFSRGKASAHRIEAVLQEEGEKEDAPTAVKPPIAGSIQFEDVSFSHFSHQANGLNHITFQAEQGETIGILGETGSGKSSLLHLVPRLLKPTHGRILIDNTDTAEMSMDHLRKNISLVPQEAHLFSGTIEENIGWGKEDAESADIMAAAKMAQIHTFITTLPDGYQTRLGQKGVTLSGGQKQRLSIARALVREPKILMLDDSTSALDAHTEARLLTELNEQQCTVLIVAQKISSLQAADRIIVLHNGEIIAQGAHSTLLKESAYYQKIYHSQQSGEVM